MKHWDVCYAFISSINLGLTRATTDPRLLVEFSMKLDNPHEE